jgi:hypothetical protein
LSTQDFILFGNTLEGSIKALALGLVSREKSVTIVVDACGYWNEVTADLALRQLAAKGATLITVNELLDRKLIRHRRYRSVPVNGNGSTSSTGNGQSNGRGTKRSNGHSNGRTNGRSNGHSNPTTPTNGRSNGRNDEASSRGSVRGNSPAR